MGDLYPFQVGLSVPIEPKTDECSCSRVSGQIARKSSCVTLPRGAPYPVPLLPLSVTEEDTLKTEQTHRIRFRVASTVALVCWLVASAPVRTHAQSGVTAGTVALLVEPKGIADVNALRDAISHADPAVRAIAARVAGILLRKDLATPLLDLLAREEDPDVAREQVRTLLYLKGTDALPQARVAVTRLGVRVASTLAEYLARTQPAMFSTMLGDLLSGVPAPDTASFGGIVAMAIRQTPSERDKIIVAYAAAAPVAAWRALLDHLQSDADAGVLKAGLTAPRADVREATVWFVVADPSVTETAAAAAVEWARTPDLRTDDTEWAAFGRELLARRSQKPGASDGAEIIRRNGPRNLGDARSLATIPELTAAERAVLHAILPDLPVTSRAPTRQFRTLPAAGPARSEQPTRTIPLIRPGFLGSLLGALGCTPPSGSLAFGAARMSYHPDGRPRAIAVDTTTLTEPCAPFVRVLAMLTVSPADQPVVDGQTQWMLISMDKEVLHCLDERVPGPSRDRGGERVTAGRIKTPTKIRDVRPEYPPLMIKARVSGIVVIEATIAATGCVENARILRTIQLPMDLAALKAVSGWRFEPTRLDGVPVPVIATVTVNFWLE